jgi:hypothetical protein
MIQILASEGLRDKQQKLDPLIKSLGILFYMVGTTAGINQLVHISVINMCKD